MDKVLFGAAYYDEYMPKERLHEDMQMMKKAGINVIRIAESTWASEEPKENQFDFTHVTRSIEAAREAGIWVIVGTPTYAIPPWLAYKYPEIIAETENGIGKYGARQNMDITNSHYLYYAERVIRKLLECVQQYENVIGFQLDNETKHYHVAGKSVQKQFVEWLKKRFGTVEQMNREFGFSYWSNAIDNWKHVPDVTGTINGSFLAEFEKFRRHLVTDFLKWQRSIVEEYRRQDQFVTHNFDFEWRGYSFGVQPDVDHKLASEAVTIAGCDIYYPSQDELTGKEITFCGNINRSMKQDNYLVLETQAQGQVGWLPYDGQLRLQAFSHLANGADGVMYWHWHSIHNSFETYWKGLLSHDLTENRLYQEAASIGRDFERLGEHILHLKKENKVAILVSNTSLTALSREPLFPFPDSNRQYNDVVRQYADALYELNVEYDIVWNPEDGLEQYNLLIAPILYSASEKMLVALKQYVSQGGTLLTTCKSGFTNENLTVYHDKQPHMLNECAGVSYQEFTIPRQVSLRATDAFQEVEESDLTEAEGQVHTWMELLKPEGATVLAYYNHPCWGRYAAITENKYGDGVAIYAGCLMSDAYTKKLIKHAILCAKLESQMRAGFPIVIKSGVNKLGKKIHYYMNYSGQEQQQTYLHEVAIELLSGEDYITGQNINLKPWQFLVMEEKEISEKKAN